MSVGDAAVAPQPQWLVRRTAPKGWRRWFDRMVAQADVVTPRGKRYIVRVNRDRPLRESPLAAFGSVPPQEISLPALVAANSRGRNAGWTVAVVDPSSWRGGERVVLQRSVPVAHVADVAADWFGQLFRGTPPWDDAGDMWSRIGGDDGSPPSK